MAVNNTLPDSTSASPDEVRKLMRTVLMSPDAFRPLLVLSARKANARSPANGKELIRALWNYTEGFEKARTQSLLRVKSNASRADSLLKLTLDDAALAAMGTINKSFRDTLLGDVEIPETLPLADRLLTQLRPRPRFHRTLLLACQHLMASTVAQFRYINECGIPWSDMHVMGKPYSTNGAVAAALRREGAYVHRVSDQFPGSSSNSLRSYETKMADAANELIEMVREKLDNAGASQRVLVLDDGGLLTSVLGEKRGLESHQVVAVEQTTGGIRRLEAAEVHFPVVDVADSASKVAFEAPFIAKSIVAEMDERLKRIRGTRRLKDERILLIGYGTVGSWVAKLLADVAAKVVVFDRENRRASLAMAAGYEVSFDLRVALGNATVVIGCTGGRAFPQAFDKEVRAETVLISGSSGNLEFNGLLRRGAMRYMKQDGVAGYSVSDTPFAIVHDDYRGANDHGEFWIANGGFPINFTGAQDPIDVKDIQITRTLMLAGAVQSIDLFGRGGGIQAFDHGHDMCIITAAGELDPDRRSVARARSGKRGKS